MRIIVCNYEFPPVGGGGGNAIKYLAREWIRAGHAVTVVTSHWIAERREDDVEGIRVIRVPVKRERLDFSKIGELAAYARAGRREVADLQRKGDRYDVVLSVFAVPSGLVGDLAAGLWNIPHIIRVGGGDLPGHEKRLRLFHIFMKPVVRGLLKRAAFRVANSEGLRERAEAAVGMPFEVVENGVDLDEFSPAPGGPIHDPPVILFVSRIIRRKGLQFLLPALAKLAGEGFDFRLVVAGDGPLRPRLQEMARSLQIADHIEWLGLVDHDDLPAVYRRGDVFVLPSMSEGMANVALEAAASGLPLILTDVPGTKELLLEGQNGLLSPVADPDGLADALRRILADPDLRRRMGEASRRHVARWSWEAMARKFLDLFERAVAGERG